MLLSERELEKVFAETKRRRDLSRNKGYYYFDAMVRLHYELGCRPGELCAIKWEDIKRADDDKPILHIHAQLIETSTTRQSCDYIPVTKNEKGISKGGRYFPITRKIAGILHEVKAMQESKGVVSEYVFCHLDGSFINPKSYETYVHNLFRHLGFHGKTSYVFRRGVNQRLDELGISTSNRASLLGHTVQTNLSCYTFANRNVVEIGRKALETLDE